MNTRLLMMMHVKVAAVLNIGAVPHGTRRTAPLGGGTFEGPRLRGTILPGSADWQLLSVRRRAGNGPSLHAPDR